MLTPQKEIKEFWLGSYKLDDEQYFPKEKIRLWLGKDELGNNDIKENYSSLVESALDDKLDYWEIRRDGRISLVILLSQMSKIVYKKDKRRFLLNEKAIKFCLKFIEKGLDAKYLLFEKIFIYYPLMNAENISLQSLSVELFCEVYGNAPNEHKKHYKIFRDMALMNKKIINSFGRFPQRNFLLKRESTLSEEKFLKSATKSEYIGQELK